MTEPDYLSINMRLIYEAEYDLLDYAITPDQICLITFSPDPNPSQMIDAPFDIQHKTFVNLLADYLKYCRAGVFCLEPTQNGNPHYHGWYVPYHNEMELGRVQMIKTIKRFGNVKIQHGVRFWRFNCYDEYRNALYYYKKDLALFYEVPFSVIVKDSYDNTDWTQQFFYTTRLNGKKMDFQMAEEKISQINQLRDFYNYKR